MPYGGLVGRRNAADLGSNDLRPIGSDVVQNRFALGVGGLEAEPGDHICGVFSGEAERDQVLIPFLQAGLASGDKCICVVDGTTPGQLLAVLGPAGQAAALTAGKQLEVIGASDMYLRSGRFSAEEVIGVWKAAISDAMYAGQFDLVRVVEAWSRRDVLPDMNELLMLESEMNRFLPLYPQVIVCLYDIRRFGSGALMNLVMTHPRVLMGGMVMENPYHLTPDEVLIRTGQRDTATAAVSPITEEAQEWYSDVMTGSM
jgi:MEDS: MEthanogen/methylotroph, DcmR Sensory domain